jgi:MFS family permease
MITPSVSPARGFYIGLAIGQIWLSLISTSFVSILWNLGQNPVQVSLILIGIGLVGLILLGASIILLRSAWRLPDNTSPESAAHARRIGRKIGLRFGLIVLAEVVVIGAIDAVLGQTNHGDWIVPVTYFIVGLHFVPLAFIFQVRPYIVLGLLWVFIILLTVILTPASMMLGQGLSAWVLFPIAGCGLATWVVMAYILRANINRVHHVLHLPSPA